jgi:Flp pilus assembly protein TadG
MLELLLVLPLLVLMVFGMIEFSVLLGRWAVVSNAAREGARVAILFRNNCVSGDVESDVQDVVQARAAQLGLTVAPDNIDVTGVCGGAGTNSFVTVDLPHTFTMLPGLSVDLTAGSVMRNEGG